MILKKKNVMFRRIIVAVTAAAMVLGGSRITGGMKAYSAEAYTPVEWIYIDDPQENFETSVKLSSENNYYSWELIGADFKKNSDSTKASSFVGYFTSNTRTGYFYLEHNGNLNSFGLALGDSTRSETGSRFDISKSGTKYSIKVTVNGISSTATDEQKKYSVSVKDSDGASQSLNDASWDGNVPYNGKFKIVSACNDAERMSFRFYGLKIYIDGNLAGDFIPVLNGEGKTRIYDRVTGTFIGNGDYTHGPVISEPIIESGNGSVHVHSFEWQTITEPTKDTDGLEGEVCTGCGATRNTQKLSAYGYALYQYAMPMLNKASAGQTVTFEFGEWNSFPKSFMEKIAAKSMEGVTVVFHYKWNHAKQEIVIPFGTAVDTQYDWYGPAKLEQLYGNN